MQDAKNRRLGTIAQFCQAISLQIRHVSTIGKKLGNLQCLHISLQYGELQPTSGWDLFVSFGAPHLISTAFASWLPYCSNVGQRKPTKLCTMFGPYLGWQTIHFRRLLLCNGILPGAKFTLRSPGLALSQTAGWIKMALGMEVGLGPGHIVVDRDPAPAPKRGQSPHFRPISIMAKRLDASRCHLVWR